jgi:uncharacterized protein (DUF1697 family)
VTAAPASVALLRAVNVGGRKPVPMADLRALLERLGFTDVRSFLQSGNLVFRSDTRPGAELERFLEEKSARELGLETDFLVRTPAEWSQMMAANPFPREAAVDPSRLVVLFLKAAPGTREVERLQSAAMGAERVQLAGRQVYLHYPDGIARSRLTTAFIEKMLGTRGTGRNWNTVVKLAQGLASAPGGTP